MRTKETTDSDNLCFFSLILNFKKLHILNVRTFTKVSDWLCYWFSYMLVLIIISKEPPMTCYWVLGFTTFLLSLGTDCQILQYYLEVYEYWCFFKVIFQSRTHNAVWVIYQFDGSFFTSMIWKYLETWLYETFCLSVCSCFCSSGEWNSFTTFVWENEGCMKADGCRDAGWLHLL